MSYEAIKTLEKEIYEKTQELNKLRASVKGDKIPNYEFETSQGKATLLDFFGDKTSLIVIHNMGQGCRYCTLWADGLNGFLPHLESTLAVLLVSKDDPETQRRMANARQWRFTMASHGGTGYQAEQSISGDGSNYPGVSVYVREGDAIYLKNRAAFGPFDQFCSIWNFLSLAGLDSENWIPQFQYWKRPQKMDDGGKNIVD